MRNENGQKVKKSESTEETNKNVMETTDTDNSDVENVNINKFGSKKTSRWNRPKIDLSLKDLEKVPIEVKEFIIYKKRNVSQVKKLSESTEEIIKMLWKLPTQITAM